ncbi:MAG: hypothetical protein LUG84_02735 [Akkermansiaceae bacterium]|nr:hypothetical protein [Akkermansia sp.]MCD7798309.1 hypothetical protein [Akkermansiaceae bacterium]
MKYTFIPLFAPFLFLSSCISINTGDGPHAREKEIYGDPVVKRDMTFSVEMIDSIGGSDWLSQEDIIMAIRTNFEKSGMFGRVHYVVPQNAGKYHCHFRVTLGGADKADQVLIGTISGYTLMCIPMWATTSLDWSMSLMYNGNEIASYSSQQECKDILWLPFIIGSPFFNHATIKHHMLNNAPRYFLKEIRTSGINNTLPQ